MSVLPGLVEMHDLSYSETSSILIYGPPGIGKTTLAFSFEPVKKRFVIDIEAGLKVVSHVPASVFKVVLYTDLINAINYLDKDTEHDVVIIDTMTELGRVLMLGSLSLPAAGAGRPFPEVPVLQDWSLTIERMRNVIRRLRLLIYRKKWVFFTAAGSVDKDQLTGRIFGGPELPGKQLPTEVCYLMDEVYRMDAYNTKEVSGRAIWTQPDSIWIAKSRLPNAPGVKVVQKNDVKALDFLRG